MKLLFCPLCRDVRALSDKKTKCRCGKSSGWYVDPVDAILCGEAIPVGFANESFAGAIKRQPPDGVGCPFKAFVIPKKCKTISRMR